MTKIDIISGFLGAGKTTLINRLVKEAYVAEKLVLIENEFGEIGVDGGFLKDSGIEITEMNSGCICCSLVGDFSKALVQVIEDYAPDRIIIEPSGVGKLSDVTKAVVAANITDAVVNSAVVVVDVNKCKMYMKNFGEFFNDQIEHAGCIYFSHTDKATEHKISEAVELVREHNKDAELIVTSADELNTETLIQAFEKRASLEEQLKQLLAEESCPVCGEHHHHKHHHDEHCHCHEHDHHKHHHHECHDEHCHCHEHHHHEHDHHEHHHADDVFMSWGKETVKKYSIQSIENILKEFDNKQDYGFVIRSKGIVEGGDGSWIYFDYVPGEINVRIGASSTIGKICVIGSNINESKIAELFDI